MTRVEFEQKLKSFITKALEKGYGIDYVAIIKKDAEELYAACAKGVIPESEVVSFCLKSHQSKNMRLKTLKWLNCVGNISSSIPRTMKKIVEV